MKIPLSMLLEGAKGRIIQIQGGKGLIRRLSDMGFTPDEEVKVVHSSANSGPLVVEVKGSRVILGRGISERIIVEEVD